jgi:hypothetical protein
LTAGKPGKNTAILIAREALDCSNNGPNTPGGKKGLQMHKEHA